MQTARAILLLGSLVLVACGSSAAGSSSAGSNSNGFDPGPVPDGFTRYEAPVIKDIQPGDDVTYCQWVTPASTAAKTVVTVQGLQGSAGHHAALFANSMIEPVGTSRPCTDADMLTVTFLGAIGGEATVGPAVRLPEGMVFEMPEGQALMINAHYINTTLEPVDGRSVLDVEFAEPDPNLIVAGSFAMNYAGIQIPPMQEYTVDVSCTLTQQVSLVMYANHMHRHGTRVFSELLRQDGTKETLATDDTWSGDKAFNSPWVYWTKDAPFVLSAGDTLHERCTWTNDTSNTIGFPDEMCVGVGYALESGPQYICSSNTM